MTLRNSIFDPLDNSPVPSESSWAGRQRPCLAREAAYAALETQAPRTARRIIKDRARAFARNPRELDMFTIGTSKLAPHELVTLLKLLTVALHGSLLKGGEVYAINMRAAMLYARHARSRKS